MFVLAWWGEQRWKVRTFQRCFEAFPALPTRHIYAIPAASIAGVLAIVNKAQHRKTQDSSGLHEDNSIVHFHYSTTNYLAHGPFPLINQLKPPSLRI